MPEEARRVEQYLGEQVRLARQSKGWKQSDLADRLAELGYRNWRQSKIAKLENGEVKRPTIDDVFGLALALGVKPVHLMTPTVGAIELTPEQRFDGFLFKRWLTGHEPLFPEDERTYYAGALVPEDEWRYFARELRMADTGEPLSEREEEFQAWVKSRRDIEGVGR
jgi:transcriptional regulator with XRE-family HTH domain